MIGREDGAVTQVGWVADLVRDGIEVGSLRCPSSSPLSLTVDEVYTLATPTASTTPVCGVDPDGTEPNTLPDGSLMIGPCWKIVDGSLGPSSSGRLSLIEDEIIENGYYTNYGASWLLVRSEVNLDQTSGDPVGTSGSPCTVDVRNRNTTLGPLDQKLVDAARVTSSTIPLLADTKDTGGFLSTSFGEFAAGEGLVANLFGFPQHKDPTSGAISDPAPGATTKTGATGWWAYWNNEVYLDYRNLNPIHSRSCNVLMADGSVQNFFDVNNDGFIDNGLVDSEPEYGAPKLYSKYSLKAGTNPN